VTIPCCSQELHPFLSVMYFFPATLFHQLFFHLPSLHLAIYFLVYLLILLFPNSNFNNMAELNTKVTPSSRVLLEKLTVAHHITSQIPHTLLIPQIHYRVQKSTPRPPILNLPSDILRCVLIIFSHLCLGLPSDVFPSGFATDMQCAFLFSPMHAT